MVSLFDDNMKEDVPRLCTKAYAEKTRLMVNVSALVSSSLHAEKQIYSHVGEGTGTIRREGTVNREADLQHQSSEPRDYGPSAGG